MSGPSTPGSGAARDVGDRSIGDEQAPPDAPPSAATVARRIMFGRLARARAPEPRFESIEVTEVAGRSRGLIHVEAIEVTSTPQGVERRVPVSFDQTVDSILPTLRRPIVPRGQQRRSTFSDEFRRASEQGIAEAAGLQAMRQGDVADARLAALGRGQETRIDERLKELTVHAPLDDIADAVNAVGDVQTHGGASDKAVAALFERVRGKARKIAVQKAKDIAGQPRVPLMQRRAAELAATLQQLGIDPAAVEEEAAAGPSFTDLAQAHQEMRDRLAKQARRGTRIENLRLQRVSWGQPDMMSVTADEVSISPRGLERRSGIGFLEPLADILDTRPRRPIVPQSGPGVRRLEGDPRH
ncbi:hypothetical protein [Demequina mangrovi]|uniref:Uncharacterized protein n=1 Tax=Demequina mangrovi TaxID=1043493 RepID=A0A1H7B1Y6_9MICO|nr:hypothetical protein [Demequina mangrovi]SEJ71793.1 hypothetical protein SAMN05421637_2792 [Demequina mangrovi]